jgi:ribosomal protein S6--L-glutamate ligase
MRIAVLSRSSRLYSTRRLVDACRKRRHECRVMDPLAFDIRLSRSTPELFYGRRKVDGVDAVIPRIGPSITFFGLAVVRQFEMMGVYSVNESQAIARSRDKLRALQLLSRHDVGMPDTVFSRRVGQVKRAIELVGGAPVIIKLVQGSQGVGVILAEAPETAESMIEALYGLNQNILIQRYVAESRGRDVRAFVVGKQVVAAMTRTSEDGDFRSNIHRGGEGKPVKLSAEYRRTAVQAAQIMGLNVAGVDLLMGEHGPMVLEVNSSPGLEGIETATGVDVAGAIVRFLERNARPGRTQDRIGV